MFNTGIFSLQVLLTQKNIVIASHDKCTILFALEKWRGANILSFSTDTIGSLVIGKGLSRMTLTEERDQFLKWYNKNINNTKELHEPLQIQPANKKSPTN